MKKYFIINGVMTETLDTFGYSKEKEIRNNGEFILQCSTSANNLNIDEFFDIYKYEDKFYNLFVK